jgi:hypothetical protein
LEKVKAWANRRKRDKAKKETRSKDRTLHICLMKVQDRAA